MANNEHENKIVAETSEQIHPHVSRGFGITVICVFMALLLLPTLVWGVLTLADLANPAIMEKLDFDTGENRTMASFPTTFNPKTFPTEVESWYNDNLPFRSVLYTAQKNLQNTLEKPWKNTILPALLKTFYSTPDQTQTPPPQEEIKDPYGEEDAIIIPPKQEDNVPNFEIISRGDPQCMHSSKNAVTESEASCSEYGSVIYSCTDCSFIYREYIKKLEHSYVCADLKEARCDVTVENEYVCTVCSEVYVVQLPKRHVGDVVTEVAPSYEDYGYTLCQCTICGGQYRTNVVNKLIDNSYFAPIYASDEALEGRYKWLFYRTGDTRYGKGDSMDYFRATNLPTDEEYLEYTQTFQTLNNLLKERDIQLLIAIFPNKEQVYPEYYPSVEIMSEYKRVERLVDYIKQNSDVNIVYPLQELLDAKPYWELYYKHDTHWNQAGAFIGLQAMYKALGLETTNLMSLPVFDSPETVIGDLIGMAGYSSTEYYGGKDYRIVYRENVELLSEVGNYEVTNSRRTTSNGPIDKRLVWIGDSYRGMARNYFERDFTYTFHTHRNKVVHANAKPEVLEADILVLQIVERREAELLVMANALINFLNSSEAQ